MIQSDSGRPLMDGLFPVHRVPKVHNKSAIHRHSLPVDGAFLIWQDKGIKKSSWKNIWLVSDWIRRAGKGILTSQSARVPASLA